MELKALEECTPSQKDFIGTTFPTPKGGVLTVVGCCKEMCGRAALFEVECSICSKDTKLFPDGFKSVKRGLKIGKTPCSCSNNYKWSEKQYRVRVERECSKRGYTFLGWVGDFIGGDTKINIRNINNGNVWNTGNVRHLLGGSGCPLEGLEKSASSRRKIFSDVVRQITSVCSLEGHTFIVLPEYRNAYSKFKWVCKEGHDCESTVNNFLNHGHRCKTCVYGNFGFYKERKHEQDYLYIYKIKGQPYIKVGRSFEPDVSLKQNQRRINKYYGNNKHKITQTHLFRGTHEEIFNLEQEILTKEFITYGVDLDDGYGSSELLKEECYDGVVAFCERLLEQGVIRSG